MKASLIVERCLLTDLDDLNVLLLKRYAFFLEVFVFELTGVIF